MQKRYQEEEFFFYLKYRCPTLELLHVALIYKGGRGWDGLRDVWRVKQKYTACRGIVSGHWFRSLAADALCQVVAMQCEMRLRY